MNGLGDCEDCVWLQTYIEKYSNSFYISSLNPVCLDRLVGINPPLRLTGLTLMRKVGTGSNLD